MTLIRLNATKYACFPPTPLMSDKNELEFGSRFKEIQARLHGYIFSLTGDLNDTDDLFQQTAVILWNKFDQYDSEKSFFSWACGISRFEVMNFLRKRSAKRLYFTDDLNLQLMETFEKSSDLEFELRKSALEKCKEHLREKDRKLVTECYAEKKGVQNVAERLDRSTQSIHNSLKRIRMALFECIQRTLAKAGGNDPLKMEGRQL